MSIWDLPEMQTGGDYVSFGNVGDTVTGVVLDVRPHRFDDGKIVAKILLDCEGEERILTGGAIRLKAALKEARPEKGDTLTVTFTGEEKLQGGKTMRHWDVKVARGGTSTPTPTPTPTAAADDPLDLASLPADKQAKAKEALAALGL